MTTAPQRFGGELILNYYAGINVDGNAGLTTLDLVDLHHLVDAFDTDMPNKESTSDQANNRVVVSDDGDYRVSFAADGASDENAEVFEWDVFAISQTTTAVTGATAADPVVVTAVAHGLENGDHVKLASVGGMVELNDKVYVVANKADDTFELNDDNAGDIDGSGYTPFTTGGTVALATKTICHSHRFFGTAVDVGAFGDGASFVTLVGGDAVELYVKCNTGAVDFLHEHCCFSIQRVG